MAQMTLDNLKLKVSQTMVQCQLCRYKDYALASHLKEAHSLTVGQYRNRFKDAQVTSSVVLAMMKQRPRTRIVVADPFDDIWQHITDWELKDIEAIGAALPPVELGNGVTVDNVPEFDTTYVLPKREAGIVALSVSEGMNLFISGPTETGKTSTVWQTHAAMKRACLRCNMNGEVTVKNFVGQVHLRNGQTEFEPGILPVAMLAGCTLLIDEIDFTPPHIASVLHAPLEKGRTLYIPEWGRTIKARKGFTVIATANTGGKGDTSGMYTGTEVLNTAFLDRFPLRVEMDYMLQTMEEGVLSSKFPGVDKNFISKLVNFAVEVRTAFKQGSIPITLGARKLEDFLRVYSKLGFHEAYRLVLNDWLNAEEQQLLQQIKDRCF